MAKQEADGLKKISISFLKKQGYLGAFGNSGTMRWSRYGEEIGSIGITSFMRDEKVVKLYYTQTDRGTGEKKEFNYNIPLTTTTCNYGGVRYWFACPMYRNGVYCGRRVGVLYKGGNYFACRHCYDLAYECQKSKFGAIFSYPEQEKMEREIKRWYYRGKMTRKHRSLMKKIERDDIKMLRLGKLL